MLSDDCLRCWVVLLTSRSYWNDVLCGCRQILIGLIRSYRYDKELVDPTIANKEAAILRETIRTKQLDSDNFLLILSTRNAYQLRATFECYKQNYGFSIDQVTVFTSCLNNLLNSASCSFFSFMCILFYLLLWFFYRTLRAVERVCWNLYWRWLSGALIRQRNILLRYYLQKNILVFL